VFLNLLVHAEQCAAEAPGKSISAASTMIGGRLLVEIGYAVPVRSPHDDSGEPVIDPFDGASADPGARYETPQAGPSVETGALGLGVCQGIVHSHGGEIRFRTRGGTARFEIDLPLSRLPGEESQSDDAHVAPAPLTLLLVESESAGQRQLMKALSSRKHRVVPSTAEEAADLAQRLKFDAAFWAVRPGGSRGTDCQERTRSHVPVFVLVSDVYDSELARSLESGGGFLISRPIQDPQLDRVLQKIDSLSHSRQ
jgi:CheY-like chemotaxis protein